MNFDARPRKSKRTPTHPVRVGILALSVTSSFMTSCVTTSTTADNSAIDTGLPAWLHAPDELARATDLEAAASLLCARDTHAVIDDDIRSKSHVSDGQVTGAMVHGKTRDEARALLVQKLPLASALRATHLGVVESEAVGGESCAAFVAARRLVVVENALPTLLMSPSAVPVSWRLGIDAHDAWNLALFVAAPDGSVERRVLKSHNGAIDDVITPSKGIGRYTIELVMDHADERAGAPEVALLWPLVVGQARLAPNPAVLFPDAGHDDTALSHRAEALVQRLRNEQLIDPLKESPALQTLATSRAQALAQQGALGHRLPDGKNVAEALVDSPQHFLRLTEVQAQASTLAEAWDALLDSPAHRFALVDAGLTHQGTAVARGKDAVGRDTITLVSVLGRKPPRRDLDDVRGKLLDDVNAKRDGRGFASLAPSATLNSLSERLARRMAVTHTVDDTGLGEPIAELALQGDASLTRVRTIVARLEDPLALGLPALMMEEDASRVGFAFTLDDSDGAFAVVLLVGEGG